MNPRTYLVSDVKDLDLDALTDVASIGICGATSTPRWLMTRIADIIRDKKDNG